MKFIKTVFLTLTAIMFFFISCKKEYSYEDGNAGQANGTWQFNNGGTQYIGNVDLASIEEVSGTKVLTITGKSLDGLQDFTLRLYTTDSFIVTSYLATLSQVEFDYAASTKTIFTGDFLSGELTVNITSLANNNITGTFSGIVEDSTGSQTQINLGTFSSDIDLSNNGSGQGGTQSAGTLGAAPDTCSPVIISGTYRAGTALTASNTVQVQVNVTTPGTYIIASNSVNGINFFKAGTFTTPGVQNVILAGSGTPQSEGIQYFSVTYGNSNCTFALAFLPGTLPVSDYLPTTIGSNWAYALEGGSASDSIAARVIAYAPTIAGNVFVSFVTEDIPFSGAADTTYFRKSVNDYYTYHNVSDIFQFDEPVYGEYIFLNDAVPTGTSTRSSDFTGTSGGFPVTGFIQVTILEKAVPVTIGAFNFSDVIKVKYEYFITDVPGIPLLTEERWFARGVGLIYDDLQFFSYKIGRYTVL
jgi:hypothetical protein